VELHEKTFKEVGREWKADQWQFNDETVAAFPGVRCLLPREADILIYLNVKFPESARRFINVGPSINRCRATTDFPCMTPRQRIWITDKARMLTGYEAMLVQGLYYPGKDDVVRSWSDRALHDLAGNAFHSGCFAAVALATMVAVAVAMDMKPMDSSDA
jgi:hypothetical protein